MLRYGKHMCFVIGLLLLFVGCGATTVGASTPDGSSPTSTIGVATTGATATVTPGGANTTPGTSTSGPLVITTDHTTYATSASMQVTLTNGLTTVIGAYNHQASCSIFALETQVNGTWQGVATVQSSLASCTQGQVTSLVTVSAGSVYHADIQAGASGKSGTFPPGHYRLRLTYTTTPAASQANNPVATDGNPAFTSLYSATLTVA